MHHELTQPAHVSPSNGRQKVRLPKRGTPCTMNCWCVYSATHRHNIQVPVHTNHHPPPQKQEMSEEAAHRNTTHRSSPLVFRKRVCQEFSVSVSIALVGSSTGCETAQRFFSHLVHQLCFLAKCDRGFLHQKKCRTRLRSVHQVSDTQNASVNLATHQEGEGTIWSQP